MPLLSLDRQNQSTDTPYVSRLTDLQLAPRVLESTENAGIPHFATSVDCPPLVSRLIAHQLASLATGVDWKRTNPSF